MIRKSVRPGIAIALVWLLASVSGTSARSAQPVAVTVDPVDLAKRDDLIGREIVIDDRLRYFQFHPGEGYDEIQLKRTPVTFRLPRALRPQTAPGNPAIGIRGILKREGEQTICDVTSFQLFPSDLERMDQAVARLPGNDVATRKAWSAWALQRSLAFDDKPLRQRALQIEGDALRLEADSLRDADSPRVWMQLAEEARRRQIPEPEPSALAHKAFRAQLATAKSSKDLDAIVIAIERFFPRVKERGPLEDRAQGPWRQDYANDPGNGYRKASADVRTLLDHRLWLDAAEKRMRAAASADPNSALDLAIQSEAQLPERPELARELSEIGIDAALRNVGNSRAAEVKELARAIRETFHRPDKAESLLRDWLKVQRGKLSGTDADGLLRLANRYEEFLGDRQTALELMKRAWKADPDSKDVAMAFRTRGYRKVGEEWVEDGSAGRSKPSGVEPGLKPPSALKSGPASLLGLSPEEVRQKLGSKPQQVVFSGTRGRLVEQWIYRESRLNRYVNFIRTPNELKPRVISDYSLPRSPRGGLPGASSETPPPK